MPPMAPRSGAPPFNTVSIWLAEEELARATGDAGAGQFLRSHPERVTVIPLPEAEMDVDTVADVDTMRAFDTSEWPQ